MPRSSGIHVGAQGKPYKVLLVPFTADLNIPKFDPHADNDEYIKKTRNFWALFTRSFQDKPKKRIKDPYFRAYTESILRNVEKRSELASAYESFSTAKRFGIVDTVISGRASTHILGAFDKIYSEKGMNPMAGDMPYYGFLVVDENGAKLRGDFKTFLKTKEALRQLELDYVSRIVSEDEGASLLGVASIVYPSIMKESVRNLALNGEPFFVGSGSWKLGRDLGFAGVDMVEGFNRFKAMVYSGIDHLFCRDYHRNDVGKSKRRFEDARGNFLDFAKSSQMLSVDNEVPVDALNIDPNFKVVNPYETSSRVVHLPLNLESTNRVLTNIRENSFGIK